MDVELARTLLVAAAAGNFVTAAERLHVTQSTVSARIRNLETLLGVKLFNRHRGGVELTAAGRRFLRHAKTLVQTLEQARQDVALPEGFAGSLTLSGRIALWDGFLPAWSAWMRRNSPHTSLRLEIGFEEEIMQGLAQGALDIGVLYTPGRRPGLAHEPLFDETLVLVSTDPARPWPDPGYCHVDWGPDFHARFSAAFPDAPAPALHANIGWLAVQTLQANGGSAYLPLRMVRQLETGGQLHRVPAAPVFTQPVYMVYPLDRDDDALATALEGLRLLARKEQRSARLDAPFTATYDEASPRAVSSPSSDSSTID